VRKRVERPGVREGYDRWAETYDGTANPVVALDRRHTLATLGPRPDEWILDAGCGTGVHLRGMRAAGSRPVGMDFSRGMLGVAKRADPQALLVQGDLNREFPMRRRVFDALVSSLVSEHLVDLRTFFAEAFAVLRPGGRFVFSAFHPDPARDGIEANFSDGRTEYRLGAEPYTTEDYLDRMSDAGFRIDAISEHGVDDEIMAHAPESSKHVGTPLLLLVRASRAA
jgi:ubiquinone/menaquinone biosynthesis C-methylase UbiE